jgi:hypothetical protein
LLLFVCPQAIWWSWFAKKFDGTQERAHKDHGSHMLSHVGTLKNRRWNSGTSWNWPGSVEDLRPEFLSSFIFAKSYDIWTPNGGVYTDSAGYAFLVNYFSYVRTFLNDGHFEKAKQAALDARDGWDKRRN